ncbi:HAD family phosphatase [Saccharopolyspora rhizosphaerae]|uniref:HAD family phosphatase n=1 Tax=Saccharopolyspora rhizosphaerae TaxID=2492662 RepID=A0A3R8Q5L4_9PSEU|nr:HAD hydrolase family protein [Saccharopolyspora rhizosphaerae]RRO13674.1 HAD family phosphatase [Saccharopolyspora rhizosphaerae]
MSVDSKPELVALDVDGTLLDPDTQTISDAVKAAVRRVVESGAQLVVATGRTFLGTTPVLDELSLTSGFALCSNGAVLVDVAQREPVSVASFNAAPVLRTLREHLPGCIFAAEAVGVGNLVSAPFDPEKLHGPQRRTPVDELAARPVPRLIAEWTGHDPAELAETLAGLRLPHCTLSVDTYEPWATVVPEGQTKGAALEKLRTELGISAERTFAAGDGTNDFEMLKWAARGVAMGQAPLELRATADATLGTVAEDGLAAELDRLFD